MATSTKPKPAPSGAANNVGKGQSSRMAKGRDAKARVEANAAAVDRLNGEPTRDDLVKEAQQLQIKGASGMRKDQLLQAIAKAVPGSAPIPAAHVVPDTPQERAARVTRARDQHKALQAWAKAGSKGTRPETPDLDAIEAQAANGGAAKAPKAKRAGSGAARTRLGVRGLAGAKARQELDGKAPERQRITDEQLAAHVAKVRKAHPDTTISDELWHAHWIDRIAVTRDRLAQAWEAAAAK